jgi:hypothetical protein
VTLSRSDLVGGPFTTVPNGSAIMSPSNRVNPDTTPANGKFGWDVLAGFYKVHAAKAGCTSADSAVMNIPPPVTNLVLVLNCGGGGGGPVPGPTATATSTPTPTATATPTSTATPTGTDSPTPSPTPTGSASGSAPTLVDAPEVRGVTRVGRTLTCRASYANVVGQGTAWLREGRLIPGSQKARYKVRPGDLHHLISCETAAYNLDGGWTAASRSAAVRVKLGRPLHAIHRPHVSGHASIGTRLTAHPGRWSPRASSYKYVWTRDGKRIHGADGHRYRVVVADFDKHIRVMVIAKHHGYHNGRSASHAKHIE